MPGRRACQRRGSSSDAALKPSSFTLLTVAAINVGQLIGGTIIIEQIFAINGVGELLVTAIFRDYLIVQGSVVLIAVSFVIIASSWTCYARPSTPGSGMPDPSRSTTIEPGSPIVPGGVARPPSRRSSPATRPSTRRRRSGSRSGSRWASSC